MNHAVATVPEAWLCKEDGISLDDQIIIISAVFGSATGLLIIAVVVLGYYYARLRKRVAKGKGEKKRRSSYRGNQGYTEDGEGSQTNFNRQSSVGGDYGRGWDNKPGNGRYSNALRGGEEESGGRHKEHNNRDYPLEERQPNFSRQPSQSRYDVGRKPSNDPRSSINHGSSYNTNYNNSNNNFNSNNNRRYSNSRYY